MHLAFLPATALALSLGAASSHAAALQKVATFTDPAQVTGVAVSAQGRIFVNFPRWEQDVPVSVAEVKPGGALVPFPNADWNAYRNTHQLDPADHFVCVQSVVVGPDEKLYVVDPAAPGLTFVVPGGPKVIQIDLGTNQVTRVYRFGPEVAPQGSYLNDIRFTPDGKRAVLTDSGRPGALLTLDIGTGAVRRVLAGDQATQHDPGFVPVSHGKKLVMADGQPATFNADSLAIDPQGTYAYWQATSGDTLRRAPVAALFDAALDPKQLAARVQTLGETVPADGLWYSIGGAFYFTDYRDGTVRRYENGKLPVAAAGVPLWPDSMAEGPDGAIYVTDSHIPQMKQFGGPGVKETALYRFK